MGIETIPTGYILIDGGAGSTVEFMSGTRPIPMHRVDVTVAHALAGQYLGMKLIYFEEFPLVEIATNTSPSFPKPWTCLEKMESKSVSFDHAVINDVSVVKAMDGIGFLSWLVIPPINSVAKC